MSDSEEKSDALLAMLGRLEAQLQAMADKREPELQPRRKFELLPGMLQTRAYSDNDYEMSREHYTAEYLEFERKREWYATYRAVLSGFVARTIMSANVDEDRTVFREIARSEANAIHGTLEPIAPSEP